MKIETIKARELRKPSSEIFWVCDSNKERLSRQEDDSFFVRGWTKDRIDLNQANQENLKLIDISGELLDVLEGWGTHIETPVPVKFSGWNFDIHNDEALNSMLHDWNQGSTAKLTQYMQKNFNSQDTILNIRDQYFEQRAFVNQLNFHKDLYATRDFYKTCISSEFPKSERNPFVINRFAGHISAIYKLYLRFQQYGWRNGVVPVMRMPNGQYMHLDKCTLVCVAAFLDIDVKICVVAEP